MKQNYWITSIYVFGLCFSTAIVSLDTFLYYETQAKASVTEHPVTALTNELVTQESTPTPSPTSKPSGTLKYSIRSFTKIETADQSRIAAAQSSFLNSTHLSPVSSIDIYDLQYDIQGKDGSWQPVSAKVYVPKQPGNYPLFVFGSGTTGIADKCAPSLENVAVENLGNYHNHMISQAAEGYVTVFPNYEGFNSPEFTQAYFISESEAKTVLAAIHSLFELQDTALASRGIDFSNVFLSGYSQGGHAALSAAKSWQELPESIELAGIVEFAGAADVHALFIESPWLAPYLVQSFTEYYGSNLQAFQVLQDQWLQKMQENNEKLCVNAAYKFYPRDTMYTPQFKDAIDSNTWPDVLANWNQVIQLNTPLTGVPDVPHLSVQGAADPIVTAQTQVKNIQKLCEQGHQVGYKEYPGVNHFDIRRAGFEFSNSWMKEALSGNPVFSSCSDSLSQ